MIQSPWLHFGGFGKVSGLHFKTKNNSVSFNRSFLYNDCQPTQGIPADSQEACSQFDSLVLCPLFCIIMSNESQRLLLRINLFTNLVSNCHDFGSFRRIVWIQL